MLASLSRVFFVVAAAAALSACTWTPHSVALQPKMNVEASGVGAGTRLYVRVIDERDDTNVGHRSVSTVGAKISAENLMSIVDAQLREGLTKKGYTLVGSEVGADATATYRLRAFKFYIEQGFWSGGENVSAALAVDSRRGSSDYSNVYRYRYDDRILVVPTGKGLDELMNAALSDILQQALSDRAFDTFVTQRPVLPPTQ